LPDLKARGKAVLVITHDDRYYPLADRLLFLEDGKLRQNPGGVELASRPAPEGGTDGPLAPSRVNE